MPSVDPDAPILDVAHGDAAVSHMVRNSLQTLIETTDDDRVKESLTAVLEGRYSLRDAITDPAVSAAMMPGVRAQGEAWANASEDERQELIAHGQDRLDAVREELEKARRNR